jgi:hypothetical protein
LFAEGITTLASHGRLERRPVAPPRETHVVLAIVVTAVERTNAGAIRIDFELGREAGRAR